MIGIKKFKKKKKKRTSKTTFTIHIFLPIFFTLQQLQHQQLRVTVQTKYELKEDVANFFEALSSVDESAASAVESWKYLWITTDPATAAVAVAVVIVVIWIASGTVQLKVTRSSESCDSIWISEQKKKKKKIDI